MRAPRCHTWTACSCLLACGPTSAPVLPGPSTSEDSAQEGGGDSGEEDDPEQVGGPEITDPLTELCQLSLGCYEGMSGEKAPCELEVRREDGALEYAGSALVWWRGRSSFSVPKHSFGVELQTDSGEDNSVDLLGMGADADWVIDGLYYDRLLVRDKLGYDLYSDLGPDRFAPQSALCELEINGSPQGVVSLVERIKRDDDRIDISEENDGEAWVMKQIDHDCFRWNSTTYGCFKLISPNDDDLSEAAAATATAFLYGWEEAIVAGNLHGEGGVFDHVDLDTAVDIVLLEEFFKNEDAFYTSLHLYKDAGDTVRWVPWDLDMTFGQFPGYYEYGNAETFIKTRYPMWSVMGEDPEFHARLEERWAELRAGPLETDALHDRIDALQDIVGEEAIAANFEIWPIDSIDYGGGMFYPVSSYEEEDAHVRAWMEEHLAWLDANIADW